MKKSLFLAFGLCLLLQNGFAQSTASAENTEKVRLSHTAFVPLGIVYGGLGYDCRFRMPHSKIDFAVSLSGGTGVFALPLQQYNYTDIPLSASVLFGNGWHSFELGLTAAYYNTATKVDTQGGYLYKNQYISTLGTLGYRLQAPNSGIFLKVYGGIGGGKTNQGEYRKTNNSEYILISETPVFKIDAFGRVALGYTF
jgi:hypothetical protein